MAAESVLFYLHVNLVLCSLANCVVSTEVISARKNRNGDLSMIVGIDVSLKSEKCYNELLTFKLMEGRPFRKMRCVLKSS